jgi:hypothetical protein
MRFQPYAVGRTTISFTSTSAGCSTANAMARAIASGGIAMRSRAAIPRIAPLLEVISDWIAIADNVRLLLKVRRIPEDRNVAHETQLRMLQSRPCARQPRGHDLFLRVHILRSMCRRTAAGQVPELRRAVRTQTGAPKRPSEPLSGRHRTYVQAPGLPECLAGCYERIADGFRSTNAAFHCAGSSCQNSSTCLNFLQKLHM